MPVDAHGTSRTLVVGPATKATWVRPVRGNVVWPKRGSRAFGAVRSYARGKRRHAGVDLFAPKGTPVVAVSRGTVSRAEDSYAPGFRGYGRIVVLHTDAGPYVLYSHLEAVRVRPGERVDAGDVLGTVGDTRFTAHDPSARFQRSKPHLHFELSPRAYPQPSTALRLDPAVLYGGPVRTVERNRLTLLRPRRPGRGRAWVAVIGAAVLAYLAGRR